MTVLTKNKNKKSKMFCFAVLSTYIYSDKISTIIKRFQIFIGIHSYPWTDIINNKVI